MLRIANCIIPILFLLSVPACDKAPASRQSGLAGASQPNEYEVSPKSPSVNNRQQSGDHTINKGAVRLYLPADAFASRVGNDAQAMANYVKSIQAQTIQFWSTHEHGEVKGLLVALGVKPNGDTRAWCNTVDGSIDDKVLRALEEQLSSIKPPKVKDGPIAFGVEFTFENSSSITFPKISSQWVTAANNANKPLMIPDELFREIWPQRE